MKDFRWYFNRLRAMSVSEVRWRLEQKKIEKTERKTFEKQETSVTDRVFYAGMEALVFHEERLPISEANYFHECIRSGNQTDPFNGKEIIVSDSIPLLGNYCYAIYKKDWHAGFQTDQKWPLEFSYDLNYKQQDEIGDARTNWELNRHFQFALLACDYYQTGDIKYITELLDLFSDWNEKNPFLYGISWTSVMEVAIRNINWIYTLGFLKCMIKDRDEKKGLNVGEKGDDGNGIKQENNEEITEPMMERLTELCDRLRIGIINMTCYVCAHYSRYSSANNHVIVEAAAMGLAGIVMDCRDWLETACNILRVEITRQNYEDGVNKEVSLHYQSFFMEAVGLLILAMQKNNRSVPQNWRNILVKMSRYVADCQGDHGETIVFGDDDEGKILDLQGDISKRDHYQYVLQMMSLILPERYVEEISDLTLLRIASLGQIQKISGKPYYHNRKSICYPEGGVSILRSEDGRVLIGIDHGPLGFGTIAAHGHADALSFQMYLDGEPVFADAGTYIYHVDLESRNDFRKTENHNTVVIDGQDQSEMLGAFLWGKRAETKLLAHNLLIGNQDDREICDVMVPNKREETRLFVEAEHDGYAPAVHRRRFEFDGGKDLEILDSFIHIKEGAELQLNFLLGRQFQISRCYTESGKIKFQMYSFVESSCKREVRIVVELYGDKTKEKELSAVINKAKISSSYGIYEETQLIHIVFEYANDLEILTTVEW